MDIFPRKTTSFLVKQGEFMSNPRKQHYVPQVYLKNFSVPQNKIWEICAFDKKNCCDYLTNIRNVAMEKDFYTVNGLEDSYYWERFYASGIEPIMGKTFRQLIQRCNSIFTKNNDDVLDDDMLKHLAEIMVIQMLRTPKSRTFHFEISQNVVPSVIEQIQAQFNGELPLAHQKVLDNFKLTDELFRQFEMPIINDPERIQKFTNILLTKSWTIYKLSDYMINSFVTSDHPVCMYNIDTKSTDLHDTGIDKVHTIINYPISAQLLICLYDQHTYFANRGLFHRKLICLDTNNEINFINKMNRLQYQQCIQHTFARPPDKNIPGYWA